LEKSLPNNPGPTNGPWELKNQVKFKNNKPPFPKPQKPWEGNQEINKIKEVTKPLNLFPSA